MTSRIGLVVLNIESPLTFQRQEYDGKILVGIGDDFPASDNQYITFEMVDSISQREPLWRCSNAWNFPNQPWWAAEIAEL